MIVNTNGYLEQYYNDCKNRKILIGQELMLQLEKLINDMNSDKYIYDCKEADKRIHFIEHCVKLTKDPFYNQPMKLLLFQKAFISALFGFKMLDGTDRFRRAMLLIARKNGKSELCSALILTEMIIGGTGLDIVCSSNNDDQAGILYDSVDKMRNLIDSDNKDTWRNQKGIKCLINSNNVKKISVTTRNKEGRNVNFCVIDEIHEMSDNAIVKSMEQSQSLKLNPKLILITTEGFVNDGVLDKELIRARGILNDEIQDKASNRYLIWLYTQDSEHEIWQGDNVNKLWTKSNPTLGIVKRYDYLEEQIALAKTSKTDRVYVLCKDFNVKQNTAESWLRSEDYEYQSEFNLEDFRNAFCLIGVDMSKTTDLTSVKVLLMKRNDTKKYIHSMYFIPSGKMERGDDDKSGGAKYKEWQEKGFLKIVDGNYIDTSLIADWIYSLYTKYHLKPYITGYDARYASEFINRMDTYNLQSESVWQRPEIMTRPINMIEADLQSKEIIGLNEMDKWCLSNCVLKVNNQDYGILEKIKGQNSRKIDGAVSLCIAYEIFSRHKSNFIEML